MSAVAANDRDADRTRTRADWEEVNDDVSCRLRKFEGRGGAGNRQTARRRKGYPCEGDAPDIPMSPTAYFVDTCSASSGLPGSNLMDFHGSLICAVFTLIKCTLASRFLRDYFVFVVGSRFARNLLLLIP
ncbi:hypothetical protein Nepgr_010035 [Nepenthes gracilis]|uniref:Uncharacterized protein n=1 Tax=Nepenthes gracilis TaxID=150966 RepID=A0AAD3SBP9_NEPGR|nr:hypothetical protein Nepgr_010035 [Nepenthes gracilis]